MGIYFYKLFDIMARRNMKKGELCKKANISKVTMTKIAKNHIIKTETIDHICKALDCQAGRHYGIYR